MKILLTAIGKRVELIKHLKTRFTVVGADCSDLNPAKYFVDKFCLIPRVTDGEYIPTLLRVCKEEKIDYLIPLLENEFPILDKAREDFEKMGTRLVLSDGKVTESGRPDELFADEKSIFRRMTQLQASSANWSI